MVDRLRVLTKLDELEGYVKELKQIAPDNLSGYQHSLTRRACERLLQLCVESTIDVCKKLVIGDRLGVPSDEADLFDKLRKSNMLSKEMVVTLRKMRGLRNVLVHEYVEVDDGVVFEAIKNGLGEFDSFKTQVLACLRE